MMFDLIEIDDVPVVGSRRLDDRDVVEGMVDPMRPWFFEDFEVGQVLPSAETRVTAAEVAWFSVTFAPPRVEAAGWSDPTRAGLGLCEWQVAALSMRLICEAFIGRTASLGAPGVERVEWPRPVLAGDTLRLDTRVSSVRESRSRPDMGLVGFEFELTNQDGACVMRQVNVILVQRRGGGAA